MAELSGGKRTIVTLTRLGSSEEKTFGVSGNTGHVQSYLKGVFFHPFSSKSNNN